MNTQELQEYQENLEKYSIMVVEWNLKVLDLLSKALECDKVNDAKFYRSMLI